MTISLYNNICYHILLYIVFILIFYKYNDIGRVLGPAVGKWMSTRVRDS